ncbi:dihydroorotase [Thermodesulforhabdus norvegica]|uniref:Dihydroorotase n=1 Tax=Thermodesulforhabdus norvegica TaxID=39841 RepID=A0A1I4UMY5_9BACT|nr:dihydroorotase [Thermodesulforhabdus norvegica]SFM90298.1 dihydroorotase [Thermodesulforhabdus norvegica]
MERMYVSALSSAPMLNLLIKNVRIIDPSRPDCGEDGFTGDLLIRDGVLVALGKEIKGSPEATVLDGRGLWCLPGLVDMHVHLREPGEEYKETVETGTRAAVAGGFVAVACMPNTTPPNDDPSVTAYILEKADKSGACRVYPVAGITRGLLGDELTEMGLLLQAGAVAFSDDGNPVMNSRVMRRALEYAAQFDATVISHCEDKNLSGGGVINEGSVSVRLGLRGIPRVAESVMVARDVALADYTGSRVHIAHVSTAESVRIIREARGRGVKVTAETAPHYFTLTEDSIVASNYDPLFKVNPPLRTERDVEAIKQALADGIIDVIATDHAPHSVMEKDVEFDYAAFGMVGLEVALPLCLNLIREGVMSPAALVRAMSVNPCNILGIPPKVLQEGERVSLTLVDPEAEWIVDVNSFFSKGKNCPFAGWKVKGRSELTVCEGRVVFARERCIGIISR